MKGKLSVLSMLPPGLHYLICVLFALFSSGQTIAQGEGPRSQLPSPIGVWAINVKYMNLDQNLLPTGNILLKNVNINADVIPITLVHSFPIAKRWARVYAMLPIVTSMTGDVETNPSLPRSNFSTSGISDGWVAFEINVKGNTARKVKEFVAASPAFTMNALGKVWYSGTYDAGDLINLGSNRTTFEFGLPMAIPIGKNPKRITWIETMPSIQFFTANNEPPRQSSATEITQRPLLLIENHISHSFNAKLYAGVDLRVQQGGQTYSDDVADDNRISIIGGGIFVGYKFFPFLDGYANYGGILAGDNDARSQMFRFSLLFNYVNLNK